MTVKPVTGKTAPNKEIQIRLAERNGQHFLIITEEQPENKSLEYEVQISDSLITELKRGGEGVEQSGETEPVPAEIQFPHASEKEFARILNFYHIAWQYEPQTFILERDEAGNVVKSFTPDFYLPEHDLYIELT